MTLLTFVLYSIMFIVAMRVAISNEYELFERLSALMIAIGLIVTLFGANNQ